ncbi:MAG: filamentous hemagglutinin N-terminal domain-containing protein [Nitrospira sp.]|nr:filamentous hemagglutinin N-terminal domain-containing protein [Nitrospira sp.]
MKQPNLQHLRLARHLTFGFSLLLAIPCAVSQAQVGTPITSSGLNTTVSAPITLPSGQTQFNITGGTRPGGGANLFHSFGNFNVPNNNIANFLNNSGLPTSNILGRVTAGNPSNIFGTIQTTNFGNANLFLINPAGIVFGPNATLNVGGSVTFTTANYLRMTDGALFNARPGPADALLTSAPVAAFGFLGSNPGAITVQGSHLSVADGTGISLIGGNITVQAGTLTAPSGQINLVSIGKPLHSKVGGEVSNGGGFAATGFKNLGTISLTQSSTIDTSTNPGSGNPAGRVLIRGGQFVMDASSIKAVTTTPSSAQAVVGGNVEVTAEHVTLSNHSSLNTSTSGGSDYPYPSGGNAAGNITFNAETFSATDSTIAANVGNNAGSGGAVTIQGFKPGSSAKTVSLTDTQVDAGIGFTGVGGTIAIRAHDIALNQSDLRAPAAERLGGSISLVSTGRIESHDSTFVANSFFGSGGPISFEAGKSIDLTNTAITSRGSGTNGGNITLAAPRIWIKRSTLDAQSAGNGHGGTISITGKESVRLSDSALSAGNVLNPPFSIPNNHADGGTVHIDGGAKFTSEQSTISAGSLIGNGGTIHVEAKKATMTDTVLTTAVSGGPQTVGGSITVDAKNVTIKNSQILSTATEGQGGTIEITSHNHHPVTNSVIDATSQLGTDGTVTIH